MLKIGGKEFTAKTLDDELKKDLIPEGMQLQCAIASAAFVPTKEVVNQTTGEYLRTDYARVEVEFIVVEKGEHRKKTVTKKYAVEGDKKKGGIEGLMLLDHILGNPLQNNGGDVESTNYLQRCLVNPEKPLVVTAEFKQWEMNGKVGNWIDTISSPAAHDAEILKEAETAQPTDTFQRGVVDDNTQDDFEEDGIPF